MIEIRSTHVFRGPNVWARMPVIRLVVDIGDLEQRPTSKMPGFVDRLLAIVPSLEQHSCSRGYPGGLVERMHEGTWIGHVLEHLALELQALAGADVSRGKTRVTEKPGRYNVIYEYRQEDVGRAAGHIACRLLNHLIYGVEPSFDLVTELEQHLIPLAERLSYGPSTRAIVAEAEDRGIPVLRLDPNYSLVQLGHGRYQKRIWATIPSTTSDTAVEIAGNKALTNRLLRNIGLPSPEEEVVMTVDEALAAASRLRFPVVIKPLDGNHGRGVSTGLDSAAAVRNAFQIAASESRSGKIVVERHLPGKDYRILVINGEVIAAAERVPAQVTGDGAHTIRQLIEIANADPRRGIGHEKSLTRIMVDGPTERLLACNGLNLESVPDPGAIVQLKQTGNISTGGTAIDRTDEIHPDNAAIARQAALVIGLDVAGIDLICPDIAQSVWAVGGGIVEVNAAPGFRMHTDPTVGKPRPAGRAVVDMLFPHDEPTRVPIVAVTGTNGKTTTARMVAGIMNAAGRTVGLTTTDGIYIDGAQIAAGDMAGPQSAQMVLMNPLVDCAVLECARGGIARSGLGFDRCNVAIVTNVASDHLGLGGIDTIEQLAELKEVVPASVFRDGCSVLNAEDYLTARMASRARGEIIFFSLDEDHKVIRNHLRERGRAVVLRSLPAGDAIVLLEGNEMTPIIAVSDIPATLGGKIRVNIQNAMAAIAGGIGANVPIDTIREAMSQFTMNYEQTPGRFNLIDIEGRQVLMDYCHNVPALERLADVVHQFDPPHAVGVITVPGDRAAADIDAFGRLASTIFDRVVIREDDNPRTRQRGEIAELLARAVREQGFPPDRISTVLDEVTSAHAAIDLADPGDLVVILVDKPQRVWTELQKRIKQTAPLEISAHQAESAALLVVASGVPEERELAVSPQ